MDRVMQLRIAVRLQGSWDIWAAWFSPFLRRPIISERYATGGLGP
ncbi:hypothetical protein [Bifidobacterium scaligerum]|nr:hypothetical protein [Bifidobacterium scaligerum]